MLESNKTADKKHYFHFYALFQIMNFIFIGFDGSLHVNFMVNFWIYI